MRYWKARFPDETTLHKIEDVNFDKTYAIGKKHTIEAIAWVFETQF